MYLRLIRTRIEGDAVYGRLYESYLAPDGSLRRRCIAHTMENTHFLIPPLVYPISVTMSPHFKRLLPLVSNVPATTMFPSADGRTSGFRTGIRFHRGTLPEHSRGCILLSEADEKKLSNLLLRASRDHVECRLEVITHY